MGTVLGFGLSTSNLLDGFGAFEHSLAFLIGVETSGTTAGADPDSIAGLYRINGYAFHIVLAGASTNDKGKKNTQKDTSASLHIHYSFNNGGA